MKNEALGVYLENIQRRPEESPVDTFVSPQIEALQSTIEKALDFVKENPDSPDISAVKAQCELVQSKIDELLEVEPPIRVRFVKINEMKSREIALKTERMFTDIMRELIETDGAEIRKTIEAAVDNEAKIASLGSPEGFEQILKEKLVYEVMKNEGLTEEAAQSIDELSHPEMKLTEADYKELRVKESVVGVDAVQKELERQQKENELLEKKKAAIIARNMRDLEERKNELLKVSNDELITKIVYADISGRARAKTMQYAADLMLFFTACDPDRSITRDGKIVGYEPLFDSVADIVELREAESLLYQWLITKQDMLEATPLALEKVKVLAEYEPFRQLVEIVSR